MLSALAEAVYRYPRLFFYPQAILFAWCVLYTVGHLEFSTKRNDLVGADKKYHQLYLKFREEFAGQDDLVAAVESEDLEKNRQFVERLGARLEAETNLFADVFYKGDFRLLGPKALFLLDTNTLDELHGTLKRFTPFVRGFSSTTNLVSLFGFVNQRFRTARAEDEAGNESLTRALPALKRIVEQASDSLVRPGQPPSPGVNALFGAGPEAEKKLYITFGDGRLYLVTARAASAAQSNEAVRRLRELVEQTQAEVPGVNAGITGESVLEFDEMAQSQADTLTASVVSFVLCGLIFIYGYRETGRPLKALVALVVGVGYTMAFTTAVVGHLNILTITFVPILMGLAIDFGVHLISRYEEELRHGRSQRVAMRKAMVQTGQGIFTGCLTTAVAFFAMSCTDFKGIQEMGLISGGGLVLCLVPMLTLLPVLLLRGRQNVIDRHHPPEDNRLARLENLWLQRPVGTLIATLVATMFCAWYALRVSFDYNLLNMQSRDLPAVTFEKKLIDSAGKSVLYGAVVSDSLQRAMELERRLVELPEVHSVESVARFLAEDSTAKIQRIDAIKRTAAALRFAEYDLAPVQVGELDQKLTFLQAYLALGAEHAGRAGEKSVEHELRALRSSITVLRQRLQSVPADLARAKLARFQQALFDDVHGTFDALRDQDCRTGLRVEDLPPALKNRFIGRTGSVLLQVYPRENVWERGPQERFVAALRRVDPAATGTPVQLLEYTSLLRSSYEEAAWYALAAIAAMILLHFRSLWSVLLALLPVVIGSVWTMGTMGLTGTPFNPANIMTLPLVVGVGVTNGIHILNRFAEEHSPSILARSTGRAVIVSALTTVAGFGSLMLGKHQGIASLGFTMAVGTTLCMIAAVVALPAILHLANRFRRKKPSGDHSGSSLGREELRQRPLVQR